METITLALQWLATLFRSDEFTYRVHQDEMLSDARHRLLHRYY